MNLERLLSDLNDAGLTLAPCMLAMVWQSSLLLAATGAVGWLLRRHRPALRHAFLLMALIAGPLLPWMTRQASRAGAPQAPVKVLPPLPRSIPEAPPVPAPATATAPPRQVAAPRPQPPRQTSTLAQAQRPEPSPPPPPTRSILARYPWAIGLAVYMGGALTMIGLYLGGAIRLARWRRTGRLAVEPRVARIFDEAASRLWPCPRFRVVLGECVPVPVSVGWWRFQILLPAGLPEKLEDEDLRAIALHELAHLRRRDPLWLSLVALLRAVLFFHPLYWWGLRRLAALAEECADQIVLGAKAEPVRYARLLARLAEEMPRRPAVAPMAVGLLARRGVFFRRVEAILSGDQNKRGLTRWGVALVVLALGGVLALGLGLPLAERSVALPSYYEGARGYAAESAVRIGPNRIAVREVVRNGSGTVISSRYPNGISGPETARESGLLGAEYWMDAANISLGLDSDAPDAAERYDIEDVRVFDHATRMPLEYGKDVAAGYQLLDKHQVQIHSIGAMLPDAVDLWMKVASYDSGEVYRLQPEVGSSVRIGSGTLTVAEVRRGIQTHYSDGKGATTWSGKVRFPDFMSTLVLKWHGEWPLKRWWLIALKANGQGFTQMANLDFSGETDGEHIAEIKVPLDEIVSIELRPPAEPQTLLFDGIRLPQKETRAFEPPPAAQFKLTGEPARIAAETVKPIVPTVRVLAGKSTWGGNDAIDRPYPFQQDPLTDQDKVTTLIFEIPGLRGLFNPKIRPTVIPHGADRLPRPDLASDFSTVGGASSSSFTYGICEIPLPIQQLASVDLYLGQDPFDLARIESMLGDTHGGTLLEDALARLSVALERDPHAFDVALKMVADGGLRRERIAHLMMQHSSHFTPDQFRQIADLLMVSTDPAITPLLRAFALDSKELPGRMEQTARLAGSDKPWLWIPLLDGAGASTTLKRLREAGLLTDQMNLRAGVMAYPTQGVGLENPTEAQKKSVLDDLLTTELLKVDYSDFASAMRKTAETYGPERSTTIFVAFLKQLLADWDEMEVPNMHSGKGYCVEQMVTYLNLWNGVNIGGQGSDIEAEPDFLRDEEWKAIAEEAVRWAEGGADPAMLPAGWTPPPGAVRVVWRNALNPELSMIGIWDPAQEPGDPAAMARMECAGDFLAYRIALDGAQGKIDWRAGGRRSATGNSTPFQPAGLPVTLDTRTEGAFATVANGKPHAIAPWRGPWNATVEPAADPRGALSDTKLFAAWKARYLAGALAEPSPKVFAVQPSEAMKAYVIARRDTTGWPPAEVALRQTMDLDPEDVSPDLKPFAGNLTEATAIDAWHAFLERDDLEPYMRIHAWSRIGDLEGRIANIERPGNANFERVRAAFDEARRVDPDLVTRETIRATTMWSSSNSDYTQRLRNLIVALRWLTSRTDVQIEAGARARVVGDGSRYSAEQLRNMVKSAAEMTRYNANSLVKSIRMRDPQIAEELQAELDAVR